MTYTHLDYKPNTALKGTVRLLNLKILYLEIDLISLYYLTVSSMVWSRAKDLTLLKKIEAEGVMSNKPRSRERGMQWQKVADYISALGQEVTSRAVRDHYNVMAKKY